jgi:hypothetical protein
LLTTDAQSKEQRKNTPLSIYTCSDQIETKTPENTPLQKVATAVGANVAEDGTRVAVTELHAICKAFVA